MAKAQRDDICLTLADGGELTLRCVRDVRAKRLKLTVNERGARLTLPPRASMDAAAHFVDQHRDWLGAQLAASRDGIEPLVRDQTRHLPLRGQQVPVCWRRGCFTQLVYDPSGGQLQFSLPDKVGHTAIVRVLADFYQAQARADIARWLPKYLPGLPRPPSRIRLRVLSSQWGSLAPDDTLTLDLALVLGEPFAFEYVLVHELCHLIHANHSRAFWNEVEARCPDWRTAGAYFHAHGRRLKAQLHSLLDTPARA